MKTVYLFYISEAGYDTIKDWCSPDIIDPNPAVPRDWELYALTAVPKYAKIFRKTRNPEYFRERHIRIDDEKYQEFRSTYSEYLLGKHPIRCNIGRKASVVVVIPEFEYRHVKEDYYLLLGSSLITDADYAKCRPIFEMLMTDITVLETELDSVADQFNELHGYYELYNCTYTKKGIMKLCEYGSII